MKKRGAIDISFGMIFSIIIVIAIIAVAGYAINYFLGLKSCTEVALFYTEFQDEIDSAWSSEITRKNFEGNLPGSVDKVCFGNLQEAVDELEYEELRHLRGDDSNLFLVPPDKACDIPSIKLKHIAEPEEWTCFESINGKVKIEIEKGSFDALVKLG